MTLNDKKATKARRGRRFDGGGRVPGERQKSPPRRSTRGAEEGDANAAAKGEKHNKQGGGRERERRVPKAPGSSKWRGQ